MASIREEAREIPVTGDFDICVVGGGCTGVFAAVCAARLGARVAIIEESGMFGGMATSGMVNIWHSLYDTAGDAQIIGGLTDEVIKRLSSRSAVLVLGERGSESYALNPAELSIELDLLLFEAGVEPFLHTHFSSPVFEEGELAGVAVEDVSGRSSIMARNFIDCTGDGSLVFRAGLPVRKGDDMQPPTMCALVQGLDELGKSYPGFKLGREVFDPKHGEALPGGFLWSAGVAGLEDITMVAGTRVRGVDCSEAPGLTRAEIEGRRQVRAICDIIRKNLPGGRNPLVSLPARIGVRETRHGVCIHRLSEGEVLHGKRFQDGIANGTYPVDIHLQDRPGVIFRHLDGREETVSPGGREDGRWLDSGREAASFYQIPYSSLVPRGSSNVLVAGRLVDADRGAYGAVRVMVNCNQTGEAAGIASKLALEEGIPVTDVDPEVLRREMGNQGSIVI